MKLIAHINSKEELNKILQKDIDGVIIGIDRLSANTNFSFDIDKIIELIKNTDKEIFININKIIHNKDLKYLEDVLDKIKDLNIKIIFYDFAVLNIAKRLGIISKLVIGQNHLNNSTMSNNYYHRLAINYSILSSEITLEEIFEIKNNTNMHIMINSYGYIPIFYSRRYLIKSYLDYINKEKEDNLYYIRYNNDTYPICEEDEGTTIYNHKILNLISEYKVFEDNKIDYLILNGLNIMWDTFNDVIDDYISVREGKSSKNKDNYVGFLCTKTIYKVKSDE